MTLADATHDALVVRPVGADQALTRHRGFLRQSLRLRRTQVGLAIVTAVVGVALLGPLFAPHSPTAFVGAPFSPPSADAKLGADYLGRDVLSRFLDGGRNILLTGFLGTVLGVGCGTALGLFAGYSMRRADDVVMRFVDLLLAFPGIVLALLVITVIGAHTWVLVCVVALTYAPYTARLVRSSTIQVRETDFVKYAQGTGVPTRRILLGEILPNIAAPLTVEFGLRLTHSIGLIAGLDYLGLGVGPPKADWGLMTQENQNGLTTAPLSVLLPIIAIVLLTVGANLVTDGIGHAAAGVDRTMASN
ncbi:MAG: transporter permease [Frankiales bacterium]|nr:transporter permease [Frankiales bacterium]